MTTSTSSISETNLIKIYPTPSIDNINIDFVQLNDAVEYVAFYNYLGNMLLNKEVQNHSLPLKFDISNFPSGVYFLSIKFENGNQITKKVVKE